MEHEGLILIPNRGIVWDAGSVVVDFDSAQIRRL